MLEMVALWLIDVLSTQQEGNLYECHHQAIMRNNILTSIPHFERLRLIVLHLTSFIHSILIIFLFQFWKEAIFGI